MAIMLEILVENYTKCGDSGWSRTWWVLPIVTDHGAVFCSVCQGLTVSGCQGGLYIYSVSVTFQAWNIFIHIC